MRSALPNWRIVAAGAAVAGYAVLSWALMSYAADRPWAVAALFGPLLVALTLGAWARRHLPTLAACALAALGLTLLVVQGAEVGIQRLYVAQHAAIHAALAWSFAITLRAGATPLITQMAERLHDRFTPAMRAYTRGLTRAWMLYFLAMIGISMLVYALAPWSWWSTFGNLVTPLSAVALFVCEHTLRYWRHPEFERVTLAQVVRAYRHASGAPAAR
jgi:uncharacterized membrane protein